jgi:hypothetical protein
MLCEQPTNMYYSYNLYFLVHWLSLIYHQNKSYIFFFFFYIKFYLMNFYFICTFRTHWRSLINTILKSNIKERERRNYYWFVVNMSYDSASATWPIYSIESLNVYYPSINDKRPIVCLCLYNLSILVVVLKKHFSDGYFLSLDLFSFGGRRMSLIIPCKRGRDTTGSNEHDKCAECW